MRCEDAAAGKNSSNSPPSGTTRPAVPERFGRTADLYGAEGFACIRAARVAVLGLGGVGGHAALALARSGVGELLLVDFDLVTASSLNRSPFAGPADVGRPKVEVAAENLARTCPDTLVDIRQEFCHAETLPGLFEPPPAWTVDAIDSLNPKVTLLAYCMQNGLPVISSMGAAARKDFTRVGVGDLSATESCPLARQVRQRLRRRGISGGFTCVYSTETQAGALPPDLGDRTYERGRVRNRLPSQMSMPGIFGYALAAIVLERLVASA